MRINKALILSITAKVFERLPQNTKNVKIKKTAY
jgi:hypothetical protein